MEHIRHGWRKDFGENLLPDDGSYVLLRPQHEGALDASDLVPGLWITVRGRVGTPSEGMETRYVVLRGPHAHPSIGQAVDVMEADAAHAIGLHNLAQFQTRDRMPGDPVGLKSRSLGDIGVGTAVDGTWSAWYHTVRSAEQPETDLS